MMDLKEMTHCAQQLKKLHHSCDYESVLSLLTNIERENITREQLQNTDIAKVLYQLLKSNCPVVAVKKSIKQIFSKWKKMYDRDGVTKESNTEGELKEPADCNKTSACLSSQQVNGQVSALCEKCSSPDVSGRVEEERAGSDVCNTSPAEGILVSGEEKNITSSLTVFPSSSSISVTSQKTAVLRSKCSELILQALSHDGKSSDSTGLRDLVCDIEKSIFLLHERNQQKYKSCVRSKVSNLRNPSNPHLRQGLVSGILSPDTFASMSVLEMAGEELRQLRKVYTQSSISTSQLPQPVEGTQTDKIRCRRCARFDCSVTVVSRGTLYLPAWVRRGNPDEDLMTFVTCNHCGQQWYHSAWVCL